MSLLSNLREKLKPRPPLPPAEPPLESLRQLDPARVIRQLGLIESAVPARDLPGWRPLGRVLVTEASAPKLEWLAGAVRNLELVSVRNESEAIAAAATAHGVIGWCTPALIREAPSLRWLQMDTAGVDAVAHIAGPLQERGILVTNLQRVAAPAIAEHAIAMLLQLVRQLHEFGALRQQRRWAPEQVPGHRLQTLSGKTLVIAGFGGIGSGIARIAQGFSARIIATRASRQAAPPELQQVELVPPERLADAVTSADVVVNALPLTPQTRGLFGSALFRQMKPGCLFVNVGRGATVVTDDLVAALDGGQVGGAALDVVDPEPLPRSHRLWRLRNVVLTPHVAGRAQSTLENEWLVMKENLRRYAAGDRLLNVVDLRRNY